LITACTLVIWNALGAASIVMLDLDKALLAYKSIVLVEYVAWITWIPVTMFVTVDARAGRTWTLPLLTRLLDTLLGVALTLAWVYKLFSVTYESLESDKLYQVNGERSTLAAIGNTWAHWDVALANALVALVTTFWSFQAVTVTSDSCWRTESCDTTIDRFLGTWDALFWVAYADKVWADATVLVGSVNTDDLLVGLAAWCLDLFADIKAFVNDAGISQTTLVAQVGKHSFLWLACWLWLTKHGSVVARDHAVLEASTSMASIAMVVPSFGKVSLTAFLIDTYGWWCSCRKVIWSDCASLALALGDNLRAVTVLFGPFHGITAGTTSTNIWTVPGWIAWALPLVTRHGLLVIKVVGDVLRKNSKWILAVDLLHRWALGALTLSLPTALILVIIGLNKTAFAFD
jgi:hypothetical protein